MIPSQFNARSFKPRSNSFIGRPPYRCTLTFVIDACTILVQVHQILDCGPQALRKAVTAPVLLVAQIRSDCVLDSHTDAKVC